MNLIDVCVEGLTSQDPQKKQEALENVLKLLVGEDDTGFERFLAVYKWERPNVDSVGRPESTP